MILTKPIEEYTLRELLLAIKNAGQLFKIATNHITEAKGQPFKGHISPIDLSNRKLGDVMMNEILNNIPIQYFSTIKFVGNSTVIALTDFSQKYDIVWPIEIVGK